MDLKKKISEVYGIIKNKSVLKNSVRVLMYHSVGEYDQDDILGIRINEKNFSTQMEFLAVNSYNVVSLNTLLSYLKKDTIPPKTISITFDDGYKDNLDIASPILEKYKFPFTIFISCNNSNLSGNYWNKWGYFDLDVLSTINTQMLSIGSHSLNHEPLIYDKEKIHLELKQSKDILEEKSGKRVDCFSYPHGVFSEILKEVLVDTGYKAAFSSIIGVNKASTDIYELRRSEITAFDSIYDFEKKLNGFYDWLELFHRYRYFKNNG